ncbi:T9SS type A sorting domain-containing protein [Flavobacterium sp.]|uniref:T9SS type A sorting domain-containing protein n=1 Tax=Flavobacterium sp. TaxID=239 RepID=UPI003D13E22C
MKNNYFKANALRSLGVLLLFNMGAFAQEERHNGVIRCHSTVYEQHLKEKNQGRSTTAEFENWIANKIESVKNKVGKEAKATVIKIPVVVHVIHNGDVYGTGENIKDEQVMSQIQVMNEDYRRMLNTPGYNTNAVGADVEVEFCLAKTDPKGKLTNGIDRVNLGIDAFQEADVENNLKPNTIWNPEEYLNMWTCRFTGDLDGVLGYAQFPSDSGLGGLDADGGLATTDGVIAAYDTFGSSTIFPGGTYNAPYDKGRTMTHEVGHWLGLRHIWGDGTSCTTNTDYCNDTPVAKAENYNCPTGKDSCASKPGKDMIENYMDYTDDTCMNVFTNDQKTRIRTVLSVSPRRKNLGSSTKCSVPLASEEFGYLNSISIYPNPTATELYISMPENFELPDKISITNAMGQIMVVKETVSNSDLKISVDNFQNGIYFLKIDKDGKNIVLKFVKN